MSVKDELKKKYGGGAGVSSATSVAAAAATGRTSQTSTGPSPVRQDAAPKRDYSIRGGSVRDAMKEKYGGDTSQASVERYQERVRRTMERDMQEEERAARDSKQSIADRLAELTGVRASANDLNRRIGLAGSYAAAGGQYDKGALERELEDMLREYGGEGGLNELISQLERSQMESPVENHRLTRVNNPLSGYYDQNFATLSAADGNVQDEKYRWINDQAFREQYAAQQKQGAEQVAFASGSGYGAGAGLTADPYEEQALNLMTEDEIAVYNYHYAQGGQEQADRYLAAIQDSLNYRRAIQMYADMEGDTAHELLFGVEAGLDQAKGGLTGLFRDGIAPTSAKQYASGMVREDLADVGGKLPDWLGGGSWGQMGYDAVTTTANMAPSILTSTVVGMVNPALGSYAGLGMMSGSAAGNARQEKLREGYSNEQATAYGLMVGASEAVMEKLLGGIGKLGGQGIRGLTDKLTSGAFTGFLNKLDNAFLRVAAEAGEKMLSEGTEEYLQEIIDPMLRNMALGESNQLELVTEEALYSGLLGAITGGVMGVPEVAKGQIARTNEAAVKKASEKYGAQAQNYVQNYRQGQDPEIYENNYNLVFEEAKAGVGLDHVLSNEETAKYLSDEQIEEAWRAGKAAGGWATMRQGGESVKVKGVAEAAEGGFELELEDGTRAKRGDVLLATHSEELALRGIEGLKVDAADANALLTSFREGDVSGDLYAQGVQAAFQAGGKSIPMQELSDGTSAAAALSGAQRSTAYELGRKYAEAQVQQERAALTGRATAPGRVHYDGDVSKLSEIQQTGIRALETVAGALGVQIHVFESYVDGEGARVYQDGSGREYSAPNGWYDPRTGDIHIDVNAGQSGRGTMLFTAAHELTHWVRQWSPDKFKALADFLMEQYGEKGVSVEELIERQQAKAKALADFLMEQYGKDADGALTTVRPLDYDAAFEELVADSMETMLADGEIVERLARLKQQDKSLWQKLKEKVTELVNKLKAAYKGLKADSAEGKYVAEMLDAAEELKRMFAEGLEDAGRNFRATVAENAKVERDAVGAKNATTAPDNATAEESSATPAEEWDIYDPSRDDELEFSARDTTEGDGLRFSFGGRNAGNADMEALARAQEMEKSGADAKMIFSQTGWFRGADRKWRFEIDDSEMKYHRAGDAQFMKDHPEYARYLELEMKFIEGDITKTETEELMELHGTWGREYGRLLERVERGNATLGNLIEHDALFEQYPALRDVKVRFADLGQDTGGYYSITKGEIVLSEWARRAPEGKLLHEIQHAIQNIEGFARGASPEYWQKVQNTTEAVHQNDRRIEKAMNDALKAIEGLPPEVKQDFWYAANMMEQDPEGAQEIWDRLDQSEYSDAFLDYDWAIGTVRELMARDNPKRDHNELYRNTAGEIEARDTTHRMDLTAGERRGRFPNIGDEDTVFAGDGVRLSARDFSYETLTSKPDMTVTEVEGAVPDNRADVVTLAKKNAAKVGRVDPQTGSVSVHVDDIDTDVLLGTDALRHGLRRTKHPQIDANYIVTIKAGEIIKNSIKINEANPKKQSASGAYVLIGVARNTNGDLYIVRSIVNQFSNELNSMDVLYAINAKREPAALNAPRSAAKPLSVTGSTISIAELMDYVNRYFPDILPEEVLKHYGYDARPEGDFGENVLYSERDPGVEKLNKALQKENAAQKAEIGYLRELVGLQSKITNGTKFTRSSVNKLAKELMKRAGAKGNYLELSELLNGIYERIATADGNRLDWGEADEAAQWLVDHIQVKRERDEFADNILRELRTMRIRLNDGQVAEVASRYGSYSSFRKAMFGSIILSKDGTPLDVAWQDLAAEYPSVFDPSIGDADMPLKLAEIIRGMRDADLAAAESEMERDALMRNLRQRIYDGYWQVSRLYTVADAWKERMKGLNDEARKSLRKKANELQTQIDQAAEGHERAMKQMTSSWEEMDALEREHREIIRELRKEKREALAETAERYQDARKKATEGRHKTAMRHRIERTVRELEKLLLRGNKKRNVKEGMKSFVEKALESANVLFADAYPDEELVLTDIGVRMSSEEKAALAEVRKLLEQEKTLLAAAESENISADSIELARIDQEIKGHMTKLREVLADERTRLSATTVGSVLAGLSSAYKSLEKGEEMYIQGAYRAEVAQYLGGLAETIGGTRVRDMTLAQLESVYKAFRMVLVSVQTANKGFTEAVKEGIAEDARMAAMEVTANGKNSRLGVKLVEELKKFGINNLKPVYFFEHLNSNTMRRLYKELIKGQSVWARDVSEARGYYLQTAAQYDMKRWDMEGTHTFRSAAGVDFKLNLQQMMSLYAYSRRDKAREHIRKGGVVIDPETEIEEVVDVNGKFEVKLKGKNNDATAYNIDDVTLGEIISKLTPQQKRFVEEMQKYLSDTMGGKGNEVSMKLHGVRLFGEKYYFPLKSAQQYMAQREEKTGQTASIKNAGFTKETEPNANNAIILTPFMDAWSDHVNKMSLYHAMTLPLEDLHRVYTFSRTGDGVEGSRSVTAAIENAFGSQATKYIEQLMKDLNGGQITDEAGSIPEAMMGKFKKGAVFMSASVLFQQSSSVARALSEIDARYISPLAYVESLTVPLRQVVGMVNKSWAESHDRAWAELKQHAPIAIIKEMGYFDMNMGKTAGDFLKAEDYTGIKEKLEGMWKDSGYRDEVLSRAPALADELAWCDIWQAVKREQHALNKDLKIDSKEFLELCGKRFTEVIDKTQVYDSVLSRSANMRSRSGTMRMATSFMAEPTTRMNMLADAVLNAKRGDKKKARRIIGAVVAGDIINAALASLVYAARDDDEDEEYWEKYLGHLSGEIVDSMNPLTYIPLAQDIVSVFQGWDVERADMAVVSDLANAWNKLFSEKATTWEKTKDVLGATSQLLGLPLKNLLKDAEALWRVVNDAFDGQNTTAAGIGYAVRGELPEWIGGGAKTNGDQLYEAIVAGDAEHEQRIRARFRDKEGNMDEGKARNALRKALRENDGRVHEAAVALNENRLEDYYDTLNAILAEGRFEKDDVVAAIQTEANALLSDEEKEASAPRHKSAFNAEHFAIAASTGDEEMMNTIKADLIQTAVSNGKTEIEAEAAAVSSIRSAVKAAYVEDGFISEAQARSSLTGYCGLTEKEAEDAVQEWKFEQENGYPLGELEDAFVGDQVSADKAEEFLRTYDGYARTEAQSKVLQWKCEKETGIAYGDVQQLYVDGEMDADRAQEIRVKYGESSLKDARKTVLQWQCEKDNGIKYSDIDVAYLSGDITEETAIDWLMKYGEKERDKAELAVQAYRWRDEHTEYKDLSDSKIDRYIDYCEDAGIDIPTFYEAQAKVTEISDAGGTVKDNVVRYIRSLPLSRKQKWAMWYAVKTSSWKDNVSF